GIGPAAAFLYSGPAINVLAIILTARVLGLEIGIARAVGAVVFSVIIGLCMHFIFLREEREKAKNAQNFILSDEEISRSPLQNIFYFALMVGILVFANWGKSESGLWLFIFTCKWYITGALFITLLIILSLWFKKPELKDWVNSTWGFTKQILPLLLGGILIAGFLLGRPGHEAVIPSEWIERLVGGNSWSANIFASVVGALMYFATLTEIPIIQGLVGAGMGKGPALALLLAGPALSLPNMIVIHSIIGTKKTSVFIILVVIMAALSGVLYGAYT
ncbi:permease, partial [bacterium]|nr:permease [bacterium]